MSGMVASFKIERPDEAECSMTITMSLGAWKLLREQMHGVSFPAWRLREAVDSLVRSAEQEFQATGESA